MSRPFGLVFFRGDLQFKANMSSGGKTLSFAFLLLTFTTGSAFAGDCIKNDYVPGFGCNPIANICQLTCQEGQDCAFYPEGGCTAALANNETVNHADMNPDKCEQLCRLSDEVETEESRCRFWRYVSFCPHLYAIDYGVYDNIPQEVVEFSETVCSLMNYKISFFTKFLLEFQERFSYTRHSRDRRYVRVYFRSAYKICYFFIIYKNMCNTNL